MIAAGVVAVVAIFTAPLWLWMASNAAAGVLSLLLDKRPLESEVVGDYIYKADHGEANLHLNSNHNFQEQIKMRDGSSATATGTWSSSGVDNYLDLTFSSFLSVQDEDFGKRQGISGLPAFKRRLGSVYVLVNDDIGEQFTRVK